MTEAARLYYADIYDAVCRIEEIAEKHGVSQFKSPITRQKFLRQHARTLFDTYEFAITKMKATAEELNYITAMWDIKAATVAIKAAAKMPAASFHCTMPPQPTEVELARYAEARKVAALVHSKAAMLGVVSNHVRYWPMYPHIRVRLNYCSDATKMDNFERKMNLEVGRGHKFRVGNVLHIGYGESSTYQFDIIRK